MTTARQERARLLFGRLANLGPGERERLLDEICEGDPHLRTAVETLLAADAEASALFATELEELEAGLASTMVRLGESPPGRDEHEGSGPGATRSAYPAVLSHYRILGVLGRGAGGVVYEAEDLHIGRPVALKVLAGGWDERPEARQRLLREARAAAALDDERICGVYEIDEDEGRLFIAMPRYDGETLKARLARGPLAPVEAARLAREVAKALTAAHEAGIVHRDIKPANIFLTEDGSVKVLDFGIARVLGQSVLTQVGALLGTPLYMSPEQCRGEPVDHRSDLWSLGVVLFEMVAGRQPFTGDTPFALMKAILEADPPRLEPPQGEQPAYGLAEIIGTCLARDPGDRIASAEELVAALDRFLAGDITTQGSVRLLRTRMAKVARRWVLPAVVAAVVGATVGTFVWRWGPEPVRSLPPGTVQIDSIAVLPFENRLGDPAEGYLVDGIHDSVLGYLARIGGLAVTSRTSVMRYRLAPQPPAEIVQELGVDALIEGAVSRAGPRLRVTVRLLHGKRDVPLWSHSFDREPGDILALQAEIGRAIARELDAEPTIALADAGRRVSQEAYESNARGLHFWNQRTQEGLARAITHFRRATELEPKWAAPRAGLALAFIMQALHSYRQGLENYAVAETIAQQALALDANNPEAHVALGLTRVLLDWDWQKAEREFRRATDLNPSYATGHSLYAGLVLGPTLRFDEAREASAIARRLDPLSPAVETLAGGNLFLEGRYQEALEAAGRALELDPFFPFALALAGRIRSQLGAHDEAANLFSRALAAEPLSSETLGSYGHALALAGRTEEARGILSSYSGRVAYASAYDIALVHLGLAEFDAALDWLARAQDERASRVIQVLADPRWAPLHGHPRYRELLGRMHLLSYLERRESVAP